MCAKNSGIQCTTKSSTEYSKKGLVDGRNFATTKRLKHKNTVQKERNDGQRFRRTGGRGCRPKRVGRGQRTGSKAGLAGAGGGVGAGVEAATTVGRERSDTAGSDTAGEPRTPAERKAAGLSLSIETVIFFPFFKRSKVFALRAST